MNIYVGNLSYQAEDSDLYDAFTPYGSVASVKIISDHETGKSRGFAFVEMEDDGEAREAIEALNQAELKGRSIVVNEARPKGEGNRRNNRF